MLAFSRISYIIFVFMMLTMFFLLPRQATAFVPSLQTGSVLNQFLVGVKPDTSEASNHLNNASNYKEKDKIPADGANVKSNTPKKNTRDLNDATTVQKVYNSVEAVSCADLGMVPEDETKGLYNYKILIDEVKKGTKIFVDGTYYLQSPYCTCNSDNEVDAGLFLIGNSTDKSKLILKGGEYFNLKGQVLIENISIVCPTSRFSYFICMDAPFVNEITIRNNYITGNIRMITSKIPLDYDFISSPSSVEKLIVDNNEFFDVYCGSGTRAIINIQDTPVKSAYIINNKVTNFSYIFYNNSITDGHPFEKYLIENNNAVIENNKVICTNDYDAIKKNGGTMSECYYCFALIVGFNVECRDNTFEGIHISDAPDLVVYDNYFNVTKLLYENNTWKNNVNFTPGIQYVDVMKSKYGTNVAGSKTERIYRKNTFTVEPDYADRFGKDRFLLRKEINTWQGDIDRIIIEDNYFDMYILSFDYYGQKFKELYNFNRNTILTDTIEHSVNTQTFAYITEKKDDSGNFIPRDFVFTNNNITCESEPFGQAIGTKKFYLIYNKAGIGDKTMVDFSNNMISIPGLELIRTDNRSYSDILAAVNFKNNTITGIDPQPYLAILPTNQIN